MKTSFTSHRPARFLLAVLLLTTACASAQKAVRYTTDGTRTYSLEQEAIEGEQSTNVRSAIVLKPEERFQSIDGFGFAITYSSCYNLLKMTPEARTALLKKTFSTTEGYGVSYARISLGCNDFSSTEYSLCDEKGPDDDLLRHFRLYTDETQYVIPVLKEILAINPNLKIIAAPWTCPRWMKVRSMNERTLHNSWTDGHLNPSYYKAYAAYFVKFVEAFRQEGINIYAVSPQNEPLNPGNCASLYMPWNEQAGFVQQLAPAFKQAGLTTKIYLFDHNYNYDGKESEQQYPAKIYKVYEGKDFEGKERFISFLDRYNDEMEAAGNDDQVIQYTDITGVLMSSVTTIINAITYVLIAFVAISLIVSSIMIGVITLISVQERTKEIGILRAIGASKKNVSSMFNAETMIIGFVSGLIGVLVTYLLCIPINAVLHKLTGIATLGAKLPLLVAIILILISMTLTLVAGVIPSRSAAKKDPVEALRTE